MARHTSGLTHHLSVVGSNFDNYADIAGLAVGVFILAEILLRQAVDMRVRTGFGDGGDVAADLDVAVGVVSVNGA